jgi:predicted membrane chloride channel (bestrophin family)
LSAPCRKLNETPFPFPWAQAATLTVFLFTITAPFAVAAQVTDAALAAILTFLAVSLFQIINEIARDIEDPFHYDPNQMPVGQMCYKLNERLLAISKTRRPIAFTDDRCLEPPHFMPSGMVRSPNTPCSCSPCVHI